MNIPVFSQPQSSESIAALAKAMIRAQQAIVPAPKDRLNPFTRSMYATLGSVMESCRQALLDAGVWITQYPVPVEGSETLSAVGLVTKLVHAESGEWQSSLLVMPVAKNDPQGFGSALTYARRYGLSAMVGIITTEDDDANEASQHLAKAATASVAPPASELARPAAGKFSENSPVVRPPFPPQPQPQDGLPRLDGVNYLQTEDKEGNLYAIANGDTRSKSALLKSAGFRWDATRKQWWKCLQPTNA